MNGKARIIAESPSFRPAKPIGWVIADAEILNRVDLAWRNRLRLEERDLEILRASSRGRDHPRLQPCRRDGYEGVPRIIAALPPPISLHDES